CMQALQTPFTY
nr:immunoglobulin light chain junction region [Macaca mulatta]